MDWLLNRARINREQQHLRKLRKLDQEKRDRIEAIENKYQNLNFFNSPAEEASESETGVIYDAREKYLNYLLQRVGIHFIPDEAVVLAREFGPALAAERVCLWLGLDYHRISAVAPRVATETIRATSCFKEMQQSCDVTGINAAPLLPHIHFGSHDIRDFLFESFRLSTHIIEIYDDMNSSIKEHVGWEQKRPIFVDQWKDINTDCLMRFYNQGILLSEYQKTIERGARFLVHYATVDPSFAKGWLSEEVAATWEKRFPVFEVILVQIHLSNLIREASYRCSREWNQILKKIVDTEFDFRVIMSNRN